MTTDNAVALDDLRPVWERYLAARDMVTEWEQARDELRSIIETALGESETGTIDGKPVVRWSHVKSNRLDATLLKSMFPTEYAQCQTTTTSRRFVPVASTQYVPVTS